MFYIITSANVKYSNNEQQTRNAKT